MRIASAIAGAALLAASTAQAQDVSFINIATASPAGSFYPSGIAIAQLISDELGIRASAQSSAGSLENVDLLRNNEATIAMINNNVAIYSFHGTHDFEGDPFPELRVLAPLFVNVDHILVAKASDIKDITEVAGKRWAFGPPGSGTLLSNLDILDTFGIGPDDTSAEYIAQNDAINALANGLIDGGSVLSGVPFAAVHEALTTSGDSIELLSLTEEQAQQILDHSGWKVPYVIPAGTYPGQDEDIQTVSHLSLIMTTTDLPEDVAYDIVATMFENVDRLREAHSAFQTFEPDLARERLMALPLEIHDGTKRYLGIED